MLFRELHRQKGFNSILSSYQIQGYIYRGTWVPRSYENARNLGPQYGPRHGPTVGSYGGRCFLWARNPMQLVVEALEL